MGSWALGGDEGETAHAPCVRRVCVNGYSHLLNGSAEACPQPPRVGDASVMLNEGMGSSGNHFGSSLVTSTFAAARSAEEAWRDPPWRAWWRACMPRPAPGPDRRGMERKTIQ